MSSQVDDSQLSRLCDKIEDYVFNAVPTYDPSELESLMSRVVKRLHLRWDRAVREVTAYRDLKAGQAVMDLGVERWVVIEGYGLYEASTEGRIRRGPRVLQPYFHQGNMIAYLRPDGGRKKAVVVHRLVAHTFLGKPPYGYRRFVYFIDGNRQNITPRNLEYRPYERVKAEPIRWAGGSR